MNYRRGEPCPNCNSIDIVKDFHRDELYCNECGLVLSQPYDDVNVECALPYGYSQDCRRGVQVLARKKTTNETPQSKIMNYRHNINDSKLMIKGHKGKFKT